MILSITDYETLFRSNHKNLCNAAYRITNDKDSAEDIVQNVFLKLWNQRNEIDIKTSILGYLYRSTTNAALNYLETTKRHVNYVEEVKLTSTPSQENALTKLSAKELESVIERHLENLPP